MDSGLRRNDEIIIFDADMSLISRIAANSRQGRGRNLPCILAKSRLSALHASGLRESVDNREAGEYPALFPQL
jgi:hypothetical protein